MKENYFALYKRDNGFYYYWTYDQFGRRIRRSTGKTSKTQAYRVAYERAVSGRLVDSRPTFVRLAEFGEGFWNYETCPIIQEKIARGGRYSVHNARANGTTFEKYVAPQLGRFYLPEITVVMVRNWLQSLQKKYPITIKTANNALLVLRQMLDEARKEGLTPTNPAAEVKPLLGNDSKRRGCFTTEEVRSLFGEHWENPIAELACLLSASTGMRMGEVRALTVEQIHEDYIKVDASWNDEQGRKTTKSGYARIIPIGRDLRNRLIELAPNDGGLIFTLNGKNPVDDRYVSNRLKSRMEELGIDWKEKSLTFHSFRHYVNTRLVASGWSAEKVRAVIGHESEEMTEHYLHLTANDLEGISSLLSV